MNSLKTTTGGQLPQRSSTHAEIAAEYARIATVAPTWTHEQHRDSVIDTFSIRWGMPKDEVSEVVDLFLTQKDRRVPDKASLAAGIASEVAKMRHILTSRIELPEGHEWVAQLVDPPLSGGPVHALETGYSLYIKRKLAIDGSTSHMSDPNQVRVEVRVLLPEREYQCSGTRAMFRKGSELVARLWVRSGPQWAGHGTYLVEALPVSAPDIEGLGERVANLVNEQLSITQRALASGNVADHRALMSSKLSIDAASMAVDVHRQRLGIDGDASVQVWQLLVSLQEYCAANDVDIDEVLADVRKQIASGEVQSPR